MSHRAKAPNWLISRRAGVQKPANILINNPQSDCPVAKITVRAGFPEAALFLRLTAAAEAGLRHVWTCYLIRCRALPHASWLSVTHALATNHPDCAGFWSVSPSLNGAHHETPRYGPVLAVYRPQQPWLGGMNPAFPLSCDRRLCFNASLST